MKELYDIKISDISETLLLTLYSHAIESKSKEPIIHDPEAVRIVEQLNKELLISKNRLHRNLANGKTKKSLAVHISIRAKKYDEYVKEFLRKAPNGIVVNIGCGLDTRFYRIDNKKVNFYDLDFPEVIEIKKKFISENDRYHFISSSVLDYDWILNLKKHEGPFIFLAEGVFMYLNKDEVKSLVLKLQSQLPGCELVCEVVNDIWLSKPLKGLVNFKMQKELKLGQGVTYNFGMRDSNEMEKWNSGIKLIDDWSYFDASEKKLGFMKIFKYFQLLRKTQWTVHYKLN